MYLCYNNTGHRPALWLCGRVHFCANTGRVHSRAKKWNSLQGGQVHYTAAAVRHHIAAGCLQLSSSNASVLCASTGGVIFFPYQSQLLSVPSSVPWQIYFFRFARKLNGYRWNLSDVIITANRLNDYILGEIWTGTKKQDTAEYLNRRQLVLPLYQTDA